MKRKQGQQYLYHTEQALNKDCNMRQTGPLHNNRRIDPRRQNNCKYVIPQQGTLEYIKQILTKIKVLIYSNTIIVGDFNSSFISMDGSSRQKHQEHNDIK